MRTDANSYRARVFGTDAARLIGFVCECGDPMCRSTVALTLEEYHALRPGLLLHEDHVAPSELQQAG
ncbi:MAG: hypothetical protein ACRDNM_01665 [Gaiellaceae bacterium]